MIPYRVSGSRREEIRSYAERVKDRERLKSALLSTVPVKGPSLTPLESARNKKAELSRLAAMEETRIQQAKAFEEKLKEIEQKKERRKQAMKVIRNGDPPLRREILLRDRLTCQVCGRMGWDLDPDGNPWHIHHVKPLSKGGKDDLENLVLACQHCNLKLGNHEE